MKEQAFKKIGEVELDNLIAGNRVPLITRKITLAAGTGTLARGSVISIEGKLANSTTAESTTTLDSVDGILTDDVDLSSTETTGAVIYVSGEFNRKFMTVGADVEVNDFERELRTLGIFVK